MLPRCVTCLALVTLFGFSLAAPFVIMGFAYNVALGAINRAMPQLMVAFVGAPAITAAGLLVLMLAAPVILHFWGLRLARLIAADARYLSHQPCSTASLPPFHWA